LGGLGYVGFAEEVRAQERQLGFTFDYVIVCTGPVRLTPGWWWVLPRMGAPAVSLA
jgi:hypothetical protein